MNPARLSRRHLVATLVVVAAAMGPELGCGRKAPPLPPEVRVADTTRDLTVVQRENQADLEWSYPQMTTAGGALPDLEKIEIWRASVPLAQEPSFGKSVQERTVRETLLKNRGEIIATLQGDGLDAATRGSKLVATDNLDQWLSADEADTVVWYAVRSVCCRHRTSAYSNIARLVPRPPPAAPENLTVEADKAGPLLHWTAPEKTLVQVERSADGETWKVVTEKPVSATEWTDPGAAQGTVWHYRLRTVVAADDGSLVRIGPAGPAVTLDFPDLYPPETPTDLVCLPEEGRVRLRWQAAAGATAYTVDRRAGQEEAVRLADHLTEVSYLDDAAPAGNITYIVQAIDDAGNTSGTVRCRTVVEAAHD